MVGRALGMGSPAAFGPAFVHEVGVLTMDQAAESPEFLRNDHHRRFLTRTHGGCRHGEQEPRWRAKWRRFSYA